MVILGSFSTARLGDGEYEFGEILSLVETPILTEALLHERWENHDLAAEAYWKATIQSDRVRFVGTVLSDVRRQIELTVVFREPERVETFCVTLGDYNRFRTVN